MNGLAWGIKPSLVEYVLASGGEVVTTAEAETHGGGVFFFPRDEGAKVDEYERFRGAITFRAHSGLLNVHIGEPWVRVVDQLTEVSVLPGTSERIIIGYARRGSINGEGGNDLLLASDASHLFDFSYAAGTSLGTFQIVAPQ